MEYTADVNEERLDRFVCRRHDGLTRSYGAKLIADGAVRVNGLPAKASHRLALGDRVEIVIPEPVPLQLEPESIPLDIRYEDEDLLVVNKPRGMIVHPTRDVTTGTLVNALLARTDSLSGIGGVARPGIVHRIDKDTSGLLLIAKNDMAHQALSKQLELKTGTRIYKAVAHGVTPPSGTIDQPIARDPKHRLRMCVAANGRRAVTHFQTLETFRKHSFVEVRLETGRTHQIRVHFSFMRHPLVGDPVYGRPGETITSDGQVLHAQTVGFIHPRTGRYVEVTSELPAYFESVLEKVR